MAGLGKNTFVDGNVLSAAQVNGYLMDQSVMRFASATARDTAIPTPSEGMVVYLDDVNWLMFYNGSAWARTGGELPYFYATATVSLTNNAETQSAVSTVSNRGSFVNSGGSITVPLTGIYTITAYASYATGATGIRHTSILVGGTIITDMNTSAASASVTQHTVTHGSYYLSAGNVVTMKVYQNQGITLSTATSLAITHLGA